MTTETAIDKRPESTTTPAERTRSKPFYRPNVDILETPEELLLLADMPGTRVEDVDIQFENGTLTMHGRVNERQGQETNYLCREYDVGGFYRTFQVSEQIDSERINAEYKDGVLTVHLPKTEGARPRKIAVKTT